MGMGKILRGWGGDGENFTGMGLIFFTVSFSNMWLSGDLSDVGATSPKRWAQ